MPAIPLWSGSNSTQLSSVFIVPPGRAVLLFASGLLDERVRTSAAQFKGPQAVCVERLVFGFDAPAPASFRDGCACVVDASLPSADMKSSEQMQTCSLPWMLEPCRNFGIIGIPGTYRLRLNDATAIGTAQVYAEWFDFDAIAPQAYGAFFS